MINILAAFTLVASIAYLVWQILNYRLIKTKDKQSRKNIDARFDEILKDLTKHPVHDLPVEKATISNAAIKDLHISK